MCRIMGSLAVVFLCWDVKPVFYFIWSPLQWLMGYSDPRNPTSDVLHGMMLKSVETTQQSLCLFIIRLCLFASNE